GLNCTVAENTNVAASVSERMARPLADARGYTFSETALDLPFGEIGGGLRSRFLRRHGIIPEEAHEVDQFEPSVVVFDNGRQRLDPVAGIQVVDLADHLVRGRMDVPAHHADALMVVSQLGDVVFKLGHMTNRGLDAGL